MQARQRVLVALTGQKRTEKIASPVDISPAVTFTTAARADCRAGKRKIRRNPSQYSAANLWCSLATLARAVSWVGNACWEERATHFWRARFLQRERKAAPAIADRARKSAGERSLYAYFTMRRHEALRVEGARRRCADAAVGRARAGFGACDEGSAVVRDSRRAELASRCDQVDPAA